HILEFPGITQGPDSSQVVDVREKCPVDLHLDGGVDPVLSIRQRVTRCKEPTEVELACFLLLSLLQEYGDHPVEFPHGCPFSDDELEVVPGPFLLFGFNEPSELYGVAVLDNT